MSVLLSSGVLGQHSIFAPEGLMVLSPDRRSIRQGRTTMRANRGLTTRLRIIHAAHRLFRDQGFKRTSITDVAQSLQMSSANVYRFFISKDDLRQAVTRRLLDANYSTLQKTTRNGSNAVVRLKLVVTMQFAMTCELQRDCPNLFELLTISASQQEDLLSHHHERITALISGLITQGVLSGGLPPQEARRSAQVFILSLACLWHPDLIFTQAGKNEVKPAELFDFCLRALRNGFQIPVRKER